MTLYLIRVGQSPRGTFGILRFNDVPFVLTLERPWEDNQENVSCIPAGIYTCKRVRSPRFGDTYEITNVPNRTHVLFHAGNTTEDTHGCILLGEEFSGTWAKPMIVSSQRGFMEFMKLANGIQTFQLVVQDPTPTASVPTADI